MENQRGSPAQEGGRFGRAHPSLVLALCLTGASLGAAALVRVVPSLSGLAASTAFVYIDHLDHLLAMGLGLLAAYRWHPNLGAAVILLSIPGHAIFFALQFPGDVPELLETTLTYVIALAGVVVIAEREKVKVQKAEALQKKAEADRALRETRERYHFLFEHTSNGIALVDARSGCFLEVNAAFQRLSGCSAADLEKLTVQEALSANLTDLFMKARKAAGALDSGEVAYVDRAGVARVALVSVVPLDDHLVFGVIHDITRLKRDEEELHGLTRRLVDIQEAERQCVARELHDEVGQCITGLRMTLDTIRNLPPEEAAKLSTARSILDDLLPRVRSMSLDLHPPMLDELGLLPALLYHVERYTSQTGVQVRLSHSNLDVTMCSAVKLAAYRIVQEALTNVARHSGTRKAWVRAVAGRDGIRVEIEDHGVGFNAMDKDGKPRFGLSGMRERAVAVGGRLTVAPAPGRGTLVTADLPLGPQTDPSYRPHVGG